MTQSKSRFEREGGLVRARSEKVANERVEKRNGVIVDTPVAFQLMALTR